jgi:hypothetical protein
LSNKQCHKTDQQQRHGQQLRSAWKEESSGSGGFENSKYHSEDALDRIRGHYTCGNKGYQ